MLKSIDYFLNKTTMYRLLIYYLGGLLGVAFILSLFGNLGFNPVALAVSTAILIAACWGSNRVLAHIFKLPVNYESSIITALILALLITPSLGLYDITFLLGASVLAMASKYVLTIKDVHIFNPVAIAVVLTALGPQQNASWWIGTALMLPFVVVGGLMIVRKIRREAMVAAFFASALASTVFFALTNNGDVVIALKNALMTSPIFFLGFVMLTEPLTAPGTKGKQTLFGVLIGVLTPPQASWFGFYASPEMALVIGNIFAYIVDIRVRVYPTLIQKVRVATNTIDFVFKIDRKLSYRPGQYMEFTLPHSQVDNRGNRRYFTLASSPTERNLRLGIKFYDPSSSYKKAMLDMDRQTELVAVQVAGDFVMPSNKKQKLVFIAGGIGVTPFRSMVKYLIDTNEERDVKVLYAANTAKDVAYSDIFEQARKELGIETTYVLSKLTSDNILPEQYISQGPINSELLRSSVPDYRERVFYISGTHQMVVSVRNALEYIGVPRHNIKTDFFPGFM